MITLEPTGLYDALVLGTREYVSKSGFGKVVLGLSGGVDSSLVAAIAVDAFGESNVVGVSLPTRYSSPGSLSDAETLAGNLGIQYRVIPIDGLFSSYLDTLGESFRGCRPDITEENIQARIRANILFALSNKFGWLVLACGNKSEALTGYATLHGDMAGGFVPLKDVFKTTVYRLAWYRNWRGGKEVIPHSVLEKAPSAELGPGQKDTDTLPPYDVLDPILKAYVDDGLTVDQVAAMGFDRGTVVGVARMVSRSEYKRRQSAPGVELGGLNAPQHDASFLPSLMSLYDNLRKEMQRKWNRDLPLEELLFDRWERAKSLGFGEGTSIYHNSYVYGDVKVGKNTWIGPFTLLDGGGGLTIGDFCSIAAGVQIYTHDSVKWAVSGGKIPYEKAPVAIHDCCHIGAQTVVARGVEIGPHSIVGAGSFVRKTVPPYTVVSGVPAKAVGTICMDPVTAECTISWFGGERDT